MGISIIKLGIRLKVARPRVVPRSEGYQPGMASGSWEARGQHKRLPGSLGCFRQHPVAQAVWNLAPRSSKEESAATAMGTEPKM